MAAYIVATVTIHDPAKFAEYGKKIAGLSEQYGGEYLVRGAVTDVLEGEASPGERVVVSRFPTAEAARAYLASADYTTAVQLRAGAADVVMRLIIDPAG